MGINILPVGSSKVRSRQTDKMLMPKKNLVAIYEHLFKEGCMVAKKDTHAPKHPELDVPNLHVMKALTSLKSTSTFSRKAAWSPKRTHMPQNIQNLMFQIYRLCQGTICMETFLLVPHK